MGLVLISDWTGSGIFRSTMGWTGFGDGNDYRSGSGFWFLVFAMDWNGMGLVLISLLEWFWDFHNTMEWIGFGTGTDSRSGSGFWFLFFAMEWNGMDLGPESDGFPRNHGFPMVSYGFPIWFLSYSKHVSI